ncbi:MAG: hypothetical protein RXR36_03945, partial [Nitrososphaeria archaeon]
SPFTALNDKNLFISHLISFFHCLVCQLIAGGVPEPTSLDILARIRKTVEVKFSTRRTLRIRLLPKGGAERKLSYELMSAIGLEAQE